MKVEALKIYIEPISIIIPKRVVIMNKSVRGATTR